MTQDKNMPAFPHNTDNLQFGTSGMSLRDYFAGQALAAQDVDSSMPDQIAKWSYVIADAMLEARE